METGPVSGPVLLCGKSLTALPRCLANRGTEFDWFGPLAQWPPGQTSGCRTQSRTSARTEPLAKTTPMSAVTMRDWFPRTARFNPSGCQDHMLGTLETAPGARMGKAPSCRGRRGPPGVPKGPPHVRVPPRGSQDPRRQRRHGGGSALPFRILAQKLRSATGARRTFCRAPRGTRSAAPGLAHRRIEAAEGPCVRRRGITGVSELEPPTGRRTTHAPGPAVVADADDRAFVLLKDNTHANPPPGE